MRIRRRAHGRIEVVEIDAPTGKLGLESAAFHDRSIEPSGIADDPTGAAESEQRQVVIDVGGQVADRFAFRSGGTL